MKSKIQNSIKFLKRFFEPAFLDKGATLKILVNGTVGAFLQTVIPLLFIPKIIHFIELGDPQSALSLSTIAFFLFGILIFVRSFYMYYWFWAMDIPFEKALYKKYIPQILRIEPNIFDRNGTGYHLSKFNSGVKSSVKISREIIENLPKIIFGFTIALYVLFGYGFWIGGLAILYILFSIFYISYIYKKELQFIFPSVEVYNRQSGDLARTIMSKQEILLSDKGLSETANILSLSERAFKIEKDAFRFSLKRFYIMSAASMFIFLGSLFLVLVLKINITAATISTFALVTGYFYNITAEVLKITGAVFENYKFVFSFWEMVDEPKMAGYDEGEMFIHKGGEIELRNISFSYERN